MMYTGTLDPASNRADFRWIREIIDDDTNEAVDITSATITFEIIEHCDESQSSPPPSTSPILTATLANGKISLVDTGTFQVWFTLTDMQTLCAGYYDVRCRITINGITTQLLAGELPVIDG